MNVTHTETFSLFCTLNALSSRNFGFADVKVERRREALSCKLIVGRDRIVSRESVEDHVLELKE